MNKARPGKATQPRLCFPLSPSCAGACVCCVMAIVQVGLEWSCMLRLVVLSLRVALQRVQACPPQPQGHSALHSCWVRQAGGQGGRATVPACVQQRPDYAAAGSGRWSEHQGAWVPRPWAHPWCHSHWDRALCEPVSQRSMKYPLTNQTYKLTIIFSPGPEWQKTLHAAGGFYVGMYIYYLMSTGHLQRFAP